VHRCSPSERIRTVSPGAFRRVHQTDGRAGVVTPGDGPASEVYDDGKTLLAYAPAEGLVAVADAPPTIDEALRLLFESAAIYYPFTDVIVADPYGEIAEGIEIAFGATVEAGENQAMKVGGMR
jgi:hypothetical protein